MHINNHCYLIHLREIFNCVKKKRETVSENKKWNN